MDGRVDLVEILACLLFLMHAIQEFYSTAPSGQVAEFHLGDTNDSSTVKTLTSVPLIIISPCEACGT